MVVIPTLRHHSGALDPMSLSFQPVWFILLSSSPWAELPEGMSHPGPAQWQRVQRVMLGVGGGPLEGGAVQGPCQQIRT